ncbi:MAG: hypothetical protein ACOYK1_01315 [Vampirovibrionia bacterium]
MRYFSNALEDRRVYIGDSGINPYAGLPRTRSAEVLQKLTAGKTLTEATTVSNITNTNPVDSFTNTNLGSSNSFKLLSSVNGNNNSDNNGDNTSAWIDAGAASNYSNPDNTDASPRYSDLSPAMRAHVDKFGETPTYVGSDGKVHVDREALIQRVVDYYAGPEGGSMNLNKFSVSNFMAAGNDERIAMLGDMRKQNDADKAAKFEKDLKLAQERDAAKAASNNPAASGSNTTAQVIGTIGKVITMLV